MFKNVASQKWYVLAFDETGTPKTGDAAQITAKLAKDYGAAAALTTNTATETEDGYYTFDLSQAETNADTLMFLPESSTTNIQVIGCPATVFTRPPYFTSLGIESDGDLTKVNTLDGHTVQTADHTAAIADIPTTAEFEARSLLAAGYTVVSDLGTVQTGDNYTRIGALGAGLTAITDQTDDLADGERLDLILDELTTQGDTNEGLISNIASGTAATNTTAGSFVKSGAEVETNAYTDTTSIGTIHIVEPDAGTTDVYYEFDVGANGVPVSVSWQGYAASKSDSWSVRAYNWSTTSWEQIKVLSGVNGTVVLPNTFDLTTGHVGTGANAGKVHVKFYSTDGTALGTDRILCSFATVYQSVGYADGAIWVDTINGTAGTVNYVNGTGDNAVLTWADALTISASLGIKRFHIVNGSTITLGASTEHYTFLGYEWTLALGGQSIAGSFFEHANVSGTATGTSYRFIRCKMALTVVSSLESGGMKECVFGSAGITLSAAGTYLMADCSAANDSVYIDFEDAAENKNLYMSSFCGDIEFKNFGHATGVHKAMLTGQGHVTLNSNCDAATAADIFDIHGMFHVTDNVVGTWGGTTDEEARIDTLAINAEVDTALSDYDGPTNAELTTAVGAVTLANGAHGGAGASITLASYADFTGAAASNPNVLQAGTITVTDQTHFVLSAGSADADAYLNMVIVFEDAATAVQKSVRTITDYTATTKTATIDSAPDFTIITTDKFNILAVAPGSTPPTVGQIRTEMDNNSTQFAAIVEDTGTTIPATITTAQNDLDIITGVSGVNLLTATQTSIDAIEADTNELQTNQGNWITATGFSTHTAADIWTVVARTLTASTNFNDITAADVKTAVESAGGHLTLIKTVTDALPNNGALTDLATAAALVAHDDKLVAADTAIDDVKTQMGTAGAGLTDLGGMSTSMKAEVNAEVVDSLNADTYAEPGQGVPGATISIAAKIGYLYKALRNKVTNDGTETKIYADNGTTVDQKSATSESGGTVTRGEMGSG